MPQQIRRGGSFHRYDLDLNELTDTRRGHRHGWQELNLNNRLCLRTGLWRQQMDNKRRMN
jgi:hypothetical protein